MKKLLFLLLFVASAVLNVYGQAKKPTLMIVPAESWCNQNGFMSNFTMADGRVIKIPDYDRAFIENTDVAMVIGAMQDFMNNEGYQVKDLKGQLANLKKRSARDNATTAGGGLASSPLDELKKQAKADIIVELQYAIKPAGPYKYIEFNVSAIDAYTSAPVSTGNIGKGSSASSTELVNQLEEAVMSFKDKFISDMDRYYNRLFQNGRQIVVRCTLANNSSVTYEDEFDGTELKDLLDEWVSDNCVKGNYSLGDASENEVFFDYVHIPMVYTDANGNEKGTDANWYGKQLRTYLESVTGTKCKVDLVGLGEINVILGGK